MDPSQTASSDAAVRVDPDVSAALPNFTVLEGVIVANECITKFIQVAEFGKMGRRRENHCGKAQVVGTRARLAAVNGYTPRKWAHFRLLRMKKEVEVTSERRALIG